MTSFGVADARRIGLRAAPHEPASENYSIERPTRTCTGSILLMIRPCAGWRSSQRQRVERSTWGFQRRTEYRTPVLSSSLKTNELAMRRSGHIHLFLRRYIRPKYSTVVQPYIQDHSRPGSAYETPESTPRTLSFDCNIDKSARCSQSCHNARKSIVYAFFTIAGLYQLLDLKASTN